MTSSPAKLWRMCSCAVMGWHPDQAASNCSAQAPSATSTTVLQEPRSGSRATAVLDGRDRDAAMTWTSAPCSHSRAAATASVKIQWAGTRAPRVHQDSAGKGAPSRRHQPRQHHQTLRLFRRHLHDPPQAQQPYRPTSHLQHRHSSRLQRQQRSKRAARARASPTVQLFA